MHKAGHQSLKIELIIQSASHFYTLQRKQELASKGKKRIERARPFQKLLPMQLPELLTMEARRQPIPFRLNARIQYILKIGPLRHLGMLEVRHRL